MNRPRPAGDAASPSEFSIWPWLLAAGASASLYYTFAHPEQTLDAFVDMTGRANRAAIEARAAHERRRKEYELQHNLRPGDAGWGEWRAAR